MNWAPPQNKLSEEEIRGIREVFERFYRYQADTALPGQVAFVDSLNEQFEERKSLSEKQVNALKNIIESCENYEERYEGLGWGDFET